MEQHSKCRCILHNIMTIKLVLFYSVLFYCYTKLNELGYTEDKKNKQELTIQKLEIVAFQQNDAFVLEVE